jgi:hypothetical protein
VVCVSVCARRFERRSDGGVRLPCGVYPPLASVAFACASDVSLALTHGHAFLLASAPCLLSVVMALGLVYEPLTLTRILFLTGCRAYKVLLTAPSCLVACRCTQYSSHVSCIVYLPPRPPTAAFPCGISVAGAAARRPHSAIGRLRPTLASCLAAHFRQDPQRPHSLYALAFEKASPLVALLDSRHAYAQSGRMHGT